MTFYLAGKYDKRVELLAIAEKLEDAGHNVIARWLGGAHDGEVSHKLALQYAFEDFNDIDRVDTFVQFNLPIEDPADSPGRNIELGYAWAQDKLCIIVGPNRSIFSSLATRFPTVEAFLEAFV